MRNITIGSIKGRKYKDILSFLLLLNNNMCILVVLLCYKTHFHKYNIYTIYTIQPNNGVCSLWESENLLGHVLKVNILS